MNWTTELLEDYRRCVNDIEYFAETHIKICHPIKGIIPIVLNDFQKQVIQYYSEKNIFASMAYRQEGKTTIAAIILLHQALFNEYRVSLVMAPKIQISNSILEIIIEMYENLPDHIKSTKITICNKTKLEFGNMCSIISGGSNINSGKGRTLSNIYIDESEFMHTLKEAFDSLYPHISSSNKGKIFALTSTKTSEYFRETA